jgi:hypothetical protein
MRAFSFAPTSDVDEALPTDGIVVTDLTDTVENIELEVVPGRGMTFDGYDSLEECLDHIDPSIRSSSRSAKQALATFACRLLGFH